MYTHLEYIALTLTVLLIVLITMSVFYNSTIPLELSAKESIYTVASKISKKILLTPGTPPTWGEDIEINSFSYLKLQDFGLASTITYRGIYSLDNDKLIRLYYNPTNPFYIPPEHVENILGIKNEYGIRIQLNPVIDLKITTLKTKDIGGFKIPVKFKVQAIGYFKNLVGNVEIHGYYFLINIYANETIEVFQLEDYNITSIISQGSCVIDYESQIPNIISDYKKVILVVEGKIAKMNFLKVFPTTEPNATLVNRYFVVNYPIQEIADAEGMSNVVIDIAPPRFFYVKVKNVTSIFINNVFQNQGNYRVFNMSFVEPTTFVVIMVSFHNGKPTLTDIHIS